MLLRSFLIACALLLSGLIVYLATPVQAQSSSAREVKFYLPYPGDLSTALVNQAWRKEKDYKWMVDQIDMIPDHLIAVEDINGDQTPEIFAVHVSDTAGFCEYKLEDNDDSLIACRLHIYAYTQKGLVEIGRMMAGKYIAISTNKTKGINDLIIDDENGTRATYIWNGRSYDKK
jgi:hypothetical protein